MNIIEALLDRVQKAYESLQKGDTTRSVVVNHSKDILDFQKMQLLEGKASSGEDLRPYYSEDLQPNGFFKSAESASRYAAWKKTISYPYNVTRNEDAPNLYINGKFHGELKVSFGTHDMSIDGSTTYSRNIVDKYGLNSFGLMPKYWNKIFFENGCYEELMQTFKKQIYG